MSMINDSDDWHARASTYRLNARKLRLLAFETGFDFCRQKQLCAVAEGFEQLADRLERAPLEQAAD